MANRTRNDISKNTTFNEAHRDGAHDYRLEPITPEIQAILEDFSREDVGKREVEALLDATRALVALEMKVQARINDTQSGNPVCVHSGEGYHVLRGEETSDPEVYKITLQVQETETMIAVLERTIRGIRHGLIMGQIQSGVVYAAKLNLDPNKIRALHLVPARKSVLIEFWDEPQGKDEVVVS